MSSGPSHEYWMNECIRIAQKGIGRVSPNPAVGAILVRDGRPLSSGFHRRFGEPHAEINCLSAWSGDTRGATLYVNLEPCTHFGKTPPCVDAILHSGIRRVVVGMIDPDPRVSGRGVRKLQREGVSVVTGICERECRELNRSFVKNVTSGLPYVHLKVALSIDGKLGGWKKQLTSPMAGKLVHRWRATHDAILVGSGTVIEDDPGLDVRLVRGRDPHVVIVDGQFRVPLKSRVFSGAAARRILVCTTTAATRRNPDKVHRLQDRGVEIFDFDAKKRRIPIRDICRTLLKNNIGTILVEAGADISAGFLSEGMIDRLSMFIAPIALGGDLNVFRFKDTNAGTLRVRSQNPQQVSAQRIGPDLLVSYLYH